MRQALVILAALLALACPGEARAEFESPLSAVREGHWLEIRGRYEPGGEFIAARIDVIQPQRYEVLIGTISRQDDEKGTFGLLGENVEIIDKTTVDRLQADALTGQRVKVEGYYLGGRRFSARDVEPRGAGRERIVGRVNRVRQQEGGLVIDMMNFTVRVPGELQVEHEEDIGKYALSESRTRPVSTTSRAEDDLFGEGIRLAENLLMAGMADVKWTGEDNYNLNDASNRDRDDYETSGRMRFIYRPSPSFIGVLEARYAGRWRDDARDGWLYDGEMRLGETFGYWIDPLGWNLDIQAGRIDFDERREWLFDQNLDGLRLFHYGRFVVTDFSVTTTLDDGSLRDENAVNTMLYLSNGSDRKHLAAYVIHRDFDLPLPEKRTHYGLRAFGRWLPNSHTWLEVSRMQGETGAIDSAGWGFDIGNTYEFDNGFNFTLGYAFGEGDDPKSARDDNFRQTGLEDNNAKFAGVTSFRYYGELADPELVNLEIVTAGLGMRLPNRMSLDLVGHRYRQDQLSRRWLNSNIRRRPNGIDKELGLEVDLVFGMRTNPSWDLEVIAAWFGPGDAFDEADEAWMGKVQLRYRF